MASDTGYFKNFKMVQFDIDKTGKFQLVPDLTRVAKFRGSKVDMVRQFMPYYIPDGERPDVTSYNTYGDVKYVWVIMFVNNIFNPYTDWPLSQKQLTKRMVDIYGSVAGAEAAVHTYKDSRGNEIDQSRHIQLRDQTQSPGPSRVVTKFEFEVDANEAKREIILPQEAFLPKLLVELGKIFK